MSIHDAEQPLGFRHAAIARTLVLKMLSRKFVEKPDLPEHRPDATHLEVLPLDGVPALRGV